MAQVSDSQLQTSGSTREDEEEGEEHQRQLELQPLWQHQLSGHPQGK